MKFLSTRNAWRSAVWMFAPATLAMGCLFFFGLFGALLESVGGPGQWTLKHYRELFADREFYTSLRFTLLVSVASTVLSAIAGLAIAVTLRPAVRRFPQLTTLLEAPIALPHLAMALVLINLAAPSGLAARIGYALGLITTPDQFPELLNDAHGFGIIATYVLKESPFIALLVLAVLIRIGPEYDDLARTLGASRWQRLRFVTIPLLGPALLSSSLIVLAFIFNAFEIPFLLGRPYPAMLSVLAQRRFMDIDLAQRPAAMAIALVMFGITLVLCWMYVRIARVLAGVERPSIL